MSNSYQKVGYVYDARILVASIKLWNHKKNLNSRIIVDKNEKKKTYCFSYRCAFCTAVMKINGESGEGDNHDLLEIIQ